MKQISTLVDNQQRRWTKWSNSYISNCFTALSKGWTTRWRWCQFHATNSTNNKGGKSRHTETTKKRKYYGKECNRPPKVGWRWLAEANDEDDYSRLCPFHCTFRGNVVTMMCLLLLYLLSFVRNRFKKPRLVGSWLTQQTVVKIQYLLGAWGLNALPVGYYASH